MDQSWIERLHNNLSLDDGVMHDSGRLHTPLPTEGYSRRLRDGIPLHLLKNFECSNCGAKGPSILKLRKLWLHAVKPPIEEKELPKADNFSEPCIYCAGMNEECLRCGGRGYIDK